PLPCPPIPSDSFVLNLVVLVASPRATSSPGARRRRDAHRRLSARSRTLEFRFTHAPAPRATLHSGIPHEWERPAAMSTGNTANESSPDAQSARPRARPGRERLDVLLVERGLAPSRERARALIMAREVRVNGQMLTKAGTLVPHDATCELAGPAAELRYASRGGLKLERALDAFALDPTGCICLDVGASTGGFTDLLLRRGARRVYAIDVGHGQLIWTLQTDPRVVMLDRTNIRHLATLPEPADCAVIDVSFISLRLVLPSVARLVRPGGWIVALVKPQFEAGRAEVARGAGVISDPAIHRRILRNLLAWLEAPSTRRTSNTEATKGTEMNGEKNNGKAPSSASASSLVSTSALSALNPSPPCPSVSSVVKSVPPSSGPRLAARGLVASPIPGRDGNHEYLLWLASSDNPQGAAPPSTAWSEAAIDAALNDAFGASAHSDVPPPKRPNATKPGGS
ncbi:MAG: TlyA family RNA methyltransferase, partial [Ktedonobacterales bacterium]